jgi:hypothetical protein
MPIEVINIALGIFWGGLPLLLVGHFLMTTWEEKRKGQSFKKDDESKVLEKEIPKYLLIIFFPITLYVFFGSLLLFLLSQLERFSIFLMKFSGFSVFKESKATTWHRHSVACTTMFPITVPILAMMELILFFYAFIYAILGNLRKIIRFAWENVTGLWEIIANWFE